MRLISFAFCFVLLIGCSNHVEFAENVLGFGLPKHVSTLKKNEQFYSNPTGDGEQVAVFSFLSDDSLLLVNNCLEYNYSSLPIDKAKLPDGAIYQWIAEKDSLGYYKLEVDTFDNTSYSIAVLNLVSKTIIVYRVFY